MARARSATKSATLDKKAPSQLPAICPTCNKKVARRGDLGRHMELHTGTPGRFLCPFPKCPKTFRQKSNLQTHINSIHLKNKKNACPQCDFRTSDPGYLTRHRKKDHGYVPCPNNPRTKQSKTSQGYESILFFPEESYVSPAPSSPSSSSSSSSSALPPTPYPETLTIFLLFMSAADAAYLSIALSMIPTYLVRRADVSEMTLMNSGFWSQVSQAFNNLPSSTIAYILRGGAMSDQNVQQFLTDLFRSAQFGLAPTPPPTASPWTKWNTAPSPTSSVSTSSLQSEADFGDLTPFFEPNVLASLPSSPSESLYSSPESSPSYDNFSYFETPLPSYSHSEYDGHSVSSSSDSYIQQWTYSY